MHAVGEDEARAEGDDDVHHRRELRLDAARLEAGVDVVAALGVEAAIGRSGVKNIVEGKLTDSELAALKVAAEAVRAKQADVKDL
mgnify:CR=1 FL=1